MRNFWIEGKIEGRKTEFSGGPRGKDGGFTLRIYMRNGGESEEVLSVWGLALSDGKLVLEIDPKQAGPITRIVRER